MASTFGPKPCWAAQIVRSASGLQLEWELVVDDGDDWMRGSLTMKLCGWRVGRECGVGKGNETLMTSLDDQPEARCVVVTLPTS